MRRRIKVLTVGCKANFADSAAIAGHAAAAGFDVVAPDSPADVVVVNSCAVTHRAERDSRKAAARSRRENPGATVVMAGCLARIAPDGRGLAGVDHWFGGRDPGDLAALLRRLSGSTAPAGTGLSEAAADRLLGHRRTFLKIQDGCDFCCAYCAVPLARGPSRSVPAEEVVRRVVACEADGALEIVLTGIHIGSYGADLGARFGLSGLIERLLDATARTRFRLSSIEPLEIDEALIDLAASVPRVCPHLHVPLQSGSARILARMRRPYGPREYGEIVERAAARIPGVQIGADVIAGFPGESRRDFEDTVRLLSDLPVHALHVFPYSVREGTESAGWPDDVPPTVKKERVRALRELDRRKRAAFRRAQAGRTLEVLAESFDPNRGALSGYSANYLPVAFPGPERAVGRLVRVAITGEGAKGTLVGTADGLD